jgi:hypothetical protein
MNNQQAAKLRPGMMIRRKAPFETRSAATRREVLIVERIEPPTHRNDAVTIHAGGIAFKAWEIERAERGRHDAPI